MNINDTIRLIVSENICGVCFSDNSLAVKENKKRKGKKNQKFELPGDRIQIHCVKCNDSTPRKHLAFKIKQYLYQCQYLY